jgi:hypothetical protein
MFTKLCGRLEKPDVPQTPHSLPFALKDREYYNIKSFSDILWMFTSDITFERRESCMYSTTAKNIANEIIT